VPNRNSDFDEVIALSGQEDCVAQLKVAEKFMNKPAVIFIILDAMQTGSTQNQIVRSGILPVLKKEKGLFLVIQEICSLANSDKLAEGIKELRRIADDFNLNVNGILANDDRLVMTALSDSLFINGTRLKTVADETKWLGDFDEFCQNEQIKTNVSNTIRYFREQNCMNKKP